MTKESSIKETDCEATLQWRESLAGNLRTELSGSQRALLETGLDGETVMAFVQDATVSALREDFEAVTATLGQFSDAAFFRGLIYASVDAIERLWQTDGITLLEAIGGYWTLKRVMDQRLRTHPLPLGAEPKPSGVLVYVPPGEHHTFGAQFLTDRLREMGASVSVMIQAHKAELFEALASTQTDVLGISIGHDKSLMGLADLINEARIVSTNKRLKVILGGRVFDEPCKSYDFLGADVIMGADSRSVQEALSGLVKEGAALNHGRV